eukprot:NODE_2315_length_1151_cov_14.161525_g1922_i0.p1 GENE.NODE_2315_length_1151_cov_14.161525_g1922_i0~~NODE_2315_length_1151_cov_14.161525_g1922_i0.p1  ORF type:complete len:345 (+),score=65.30 NODE_2315_length_1151_cov_14.161525_g1922_i0:70-1104(+)
MGISEAEKEKVARRDALFKNRKGKPKGKKIGIRNFDMYTLLGHSARVKCIAVAPTEQQYVSSSSKDQVIVMSDVKSGREYLAFEGHEDTIIAARFSADGKYLATTSRDRTLIIWDTVVGKQLFILEHAKIVICCCFSADGKMIVSGCQDKVCRVWSTKKGKELKAFAEHEGIITAVSFSPSGDHVVSASSDKTLMLWEAQTAIRVATLRQHTGIVLSCSFSTDGKTIVSSDEKLLHLWDVSDLRDTKTSLALAVDSLPGSGAVAEDKGKEAKRKTWTVASCCPSDFKDYILAACSDRNVYILDPKDGSILMSFFTKSTVYCISVGKTHIMMGDAFGNVYVVVLS